MSEDVEITEEERYAVAKAHRLIQEILSQAVEQKPGQLMDVKLMTQRIREHAPEDILVAMVAELSSQAAWMRSINDMLVYIFIRQFDEKLFQRYTKAGRRAPDNSWRMNMSILKGLSMSDDSIANAQPGEQNPKMRKRLIAFLEKVISDNDLKELEGNGEVHQHVYKVVSPAMTEFTKKHRVIPVLPSGETFITMKQAGEGRWTATADVPESVTFMVIESTEKSDAGTARETPDN